MPRVEQVKIGDPSSPGCTFGALISHAHRDKVASYVDLARKDGMTKAVDLPAIAAACTYPWLMGFMIMGLFSLYLQAPQSCAVGECRTCLRSGEIIHQR